MIKPLSLCVFLSHGVRCAARIVSKFLSFLKQKHTHNTNKHPTIPHSIPFHRSLSSFHTFRILPSPLYFLLYHFTLSLSLHIHTEQVQSHFPDQSINQLAGSKISYNSSTNLVVFVPWILLPLPSWYGCKKVQKSLD